MTYEEFLVDFITRLGKTDQCNGTLFIDCLHRAGKSTIANSFIGMNIDPFAQANVSVDAFRFTQRMWKLTG